MCDSLVVVLVTVGMVVVMVLVVDECGRVCVRPLHYGVAEPCRPRVPPSGEASSVRLSAHQATASDHACKCLGGGEGKCQWVLYSTGSRYTWELVVGFGAPGIHTGWSLKGGIHNVL